MTAAARCRKFRKRQVTGRGGRPRRIGMTSPKLTVRSFLPIDWAATNSILSGQHRFVPRRTFGRKKCQVVCSLGYPLTIHCQFGILQSGPGLVGQETQ
jgi:hypothetical protein